MTVVITSGPPVRRALSVHLLLPPDKGGGLLEVVLRDTRDEESVGECLTEECVRGSIRGVENQAILAVACIQENLIGLRIASIG